MIWQWHLNTSVCAFIATHARTHSYIHTHTLIHAFTYTYTCIHTHTHTHTYILILGVLEEMIHAERVRMEEKLITSKKVPFDQLTAFKTMKVIAENDRVPYSDLLYSVFNGDNDALMWLFDNYYLRIDTEHNLQNINKATYVTAASWFQLSVFKVMTYSH